MRQVRPNCTALIFPERNHSYTVRRSTRKIVDASAGVRYSGSIGLGFVGFIFPDVVNYTLAPAVDVSPSIPVGYPVLFGCQLSYIGFPMDGFEPPTSLLTVEVALAFTTAKIIGREQAQPEVPYGIHSE